MGAPAARAPLPAVCPEVPRGHCLPGACPRARSPWRLTFAQRLTATFTVACALGTTALVLHLTRICRNIPMSCTHTALRSVASRMWKRSQTSQVHANVLLLHTSLQCCMQSRARAGPEVMSMHFCCRCTRCTRTVALAWTWCGVQKMSQLSGGNPCFVLTQCQVRR